MSKPADFWSRRKAAVAEAEAAEAKALAEAEAAEERGRLEEKSDAEILDDLGLKDPDELQAGDDFAAFLKAAVPDRIRRRALRKLWLSNPALANLDMLVEYGEDYTDAATVVENLQSAIQLGRGALERVEAQAAAAEEEAPAVGTGETDSFRSETTAAKEDDTLAAATQPDEEGASGLGVGADEAPDTDQWAETDEEEQAPRPRRMKFHFLD